MKIHQLAVMVCCWVASAVIVAAPARADVCFIHDYKSDELLLGTKDAELKMTYTSAAMYVEKETSFTGEWMKRFFGQVKHERVATHFLMDSDQIREIDWQNRRIFVFDLKNIDKIQWIQQHHKDYDAVQDHLKERYEIKPPELSIGISPDEEIVATYPCRRVTARLKLETVNRFKQASSITLVDQTLWLSQQVPGYEAYDAFHRELAARLGIDAQRLGPLTFLLRYWNGPLEPISDTLKQIKGYTVKAHLTVIARYVTGTDADSPKAIEKQIKEETVLLRQISHEPVNAGYFAEPKDFEIIRPE